jgi:hypothetical protein
LIFPSKAAETAAEFVHQQNLVAALTIHIGSMFATSPKSDNQSHKEDHGSLSFPHSIPSPVPLQPSAPTGLPHSYRPEGSVFAGCPHSGA